MLKYSVICFGLLCLGGCEKFFQRDSSDRDFPSLHTVPERPPLPKREEQKIPLENMSQSQEQELLENQKLREKFFKSPQE